MIIIVIINYHFDTEFCLIASEKTIYNNLTRISQICLSIVVQKLKQPSLKISTQFKNCNLVWEKGSSKNFSFYVVVWALFSVFSIFCVMSFGDHTCLQHQETTNFLTCLLAIPPLLYSLYNFNPV